MDYGVEGEILDYIDGSIEFITLKIFYSLHKLLYHSNFMGKLPSIYSEARQGIMQSMQGSYSKLDIFKSIRDLCHVAYGKFCNERCGQVHIYYIKHFWIKSVQADTWYRTFR